MWEVFKRLQFAVVHGEVLEGDASFE
jgi:hypothetical protein